MGRLENFADGPDFIISRAGSGMEQHRELHFLGAEGWVKYAAEFGRGSTWEAVVNYLESGVRQLAAIQRLGPRPEATIGQLIEKLDPQTEEIIRFKNENSPNNLKHRNGAVAAYYSTVIGEDLGADNYSAAKVAGTLRSIQSLAKLGGATLSAFADLPVAVMRLKTNHGMSIPQAWHETLANFLKKVPAERRDEMGYVFDAICEGIQGNMALRFDVESSPFDKTNRLLRWFFKVNGLTPWTDAMKTEAYMGMASNVGFHSKRLFADLPKEFSETLKLYNLHDRWDVIRAHMVKKIGGKEYLCPELARDIPDDVLDGLIASDLDYISAKELDSESFALLKQQKRREYRQKLEADTAGFLSSEVNKAVLTPDERNRYALRRGTRGGTFQGEALRFMTQFKSYPVLFIQQVLQPIWHSRKVFGTKNMLGNAGLLIAQTTLFGGVAMEAKRMAKGEKPYVLTENPDWAAAFNAAFLQGGGAGLYGDFLLGQHNRFGQSLAESLAGPTIGSISDAAKLLAKTRIKVAAAVGLSDEKGLTAADVLRYGQNNTPFLNVWYARLALDWAFMWDLQELVSPGTQARRVRRMKQESRETWLSPTKNRLKALTD